MQRTTVQPEITRMRFATDTGAGARARIGLLVLESDQTMEWEIRQITNGTGVALYHSRLANAPNVTPDTLAKMETELPIAAKLLPDYLGLQAIGYGCTSGTTVIGEDRVAAIITDHHPNSHPTNPLTAAKAALKALGVESLALLTPYTPDVTEALQQKFNDAGIQVTAIGSFYEDSDAVVGKIDPVSILESTLQLGQSNACDGVFISCTSLRAAGIIEQAEAALGKPVTASNHALAWHLLRLVGVDDEIQGYGRLFQHPLSQQDPSK